MINLLFNVRFAHVQFVEDESVTKAVSLSGWKHRHRALKVDYAETASRKNKKKKRVGFLKKVPNGVLKTMAVPRV